MEAHDAQERTTLASERTSLAEERTMLAWVRTGLAATAVALGVGRVVPAVADTAHEWPYIAVGAGYALLGAACVVIGFRPHRRRAIAALAGAGVVLALATMVLVIVAP